MRLKLDTRSLTISLNQVFVRRPAYLVLALVVAIVVLFIMLWLRNLSLLGYFLSLPVFSLRAKLALAWSGWQFLGTNFSTLGQVVAISVVALMGVNIALLTYYLKRRVKGARAGGTTLLGSLVGLLGIGCASCGSVILSLVLGFSASTSFLGFLPLHGLEFGLLGLTMLLISAYQLCRKIQNPLVCVIDNGRL